MSSERFNSISDALIKWLSGLSTLLRNYFLTGVIVLVPVAVTIYIVIQLFFFADGILGETISAIIGWQIPGFGLIATFLLLVLVGMIAQNVFGKRFLQWLDFSLQSLPFIRSLYLGVKQVSDVLFKKQQWEFQKVVLVEYPKENSWVLGFITGDFPVSHAPGGFPGDMVTVFIPTTPNPTSGFLLFVSRSKVVDTAMGIEEAMKMIISGGLVKPGNIRHELSPSLFEDFTIPR